MSWIAAAIGGSAVLGFLGSQNQASAAQSAAQTQAQSAQNAQNTQLQMFNQIQQNQQPFLNAAYGALPTLTAGTSAGGQFATGPTAMTGSLQNPSTLTPFTNADLNSYLAPNYQFMLNQGLGANAQNMNVSGGGSNIDRSNTIFAENYAGNAYQNALNNYLTQQQTGFSQGQTNLQNLLQQQQIGFNQATTNQTNIFNRLASLAGLGQTSANNLANAGTTTAGNVGQAQIAAGNALAGGTVGAANAYANAAQGLGNSATLAAILSGGSQGGTNALSNVLSSGADLSGVASSGSLGNYISALSDPRAKENVELIGYLPSGLGIYDFDYKPEFKAKAGYGRYRGVMADEVEQIIPEAIVIDEDGYKMVNYGLIH